METFAQWLETSDPELLEIMHNEGMLDSLGKFARKNVALPAAMAMGSMMGGMGARPTHAQAHDIPAAVSNWAPTHQEPPGLPHSPEREDEFRDKIKQARDAGWSQAEIQSMINQAAEMGVDVSEPPSTNYGKTIGRLHQRQERKAKNTQELKDFLSRKDAEQESKPPSEFERWKAERDR